MSGARFLVQLAAFGVVLLVLLAAGQPLFSEDSWWHLSMGAVYAEQGPWLDRDPLLHTASGPPAPAAWLADVALFGVERAAGFHGLRVVHALLAAGILVLAWRALRAAGASATAASLGTACFAALSAYRLFQLRPHLLSMGAAILVVDWLLLRGERPGWMRIAASSLLFALWANLHGAFLVAFVLLIAATCGVLGAALLDREERGRHLARAGRLAIATVLGLLATLANPEGVRPHWLYFAAGADSPSLALVGDEWAPTRLLSSPLGPGPPSPLNWVLVWGLSLASVTGLVAWLRGVRDRRRGAPATGIDPALVGLALAASAGAAAALRLSWLGLFPLLLLAQVPASRSGDRSAGVRGRGDWIAAGIAVLLLPAFVFAGDWPMISRGVRPALYGRPYPAVKYNAHAVWFLRDAGLEGRLFNDYGSGNFLGYWLAPRARVFVNGSLNVPPDLMRVHAALLRREGVDGQSFEALLDRYGIELFFGIGLPQAGVPAPQHVQTTAHLEHAAGWLPVFRNVRSSVGLRMGPESDANLSRVAAYYARSGVPFDPRTGFQVERVIREAPQWAFAHGLVPLDWRGLQEAARSLDPAFRRPGQERLASIWLALGVYQRAEAIDRTLAASAPPSPTAARRLVWGLLRQRRYDEAAEMAARLSEIAAEGDALSHHVAETARAAAALWRAGRREDAAARTAVLPAFDGGEAIRLLAGFREPEARIR